MKLTALVWISALWLGLCGAAQAAPTGRALIYISPQEYSHEVKLGHFYYNYWFSQGKAVKPIALDALKPLFAETAMCEGNAAADVVIWIKPRMFYNPRMTTFYGKIVAQVHSGSGKPIATYTANAQRDGFLDVKPAERVRATYQAAMQEIVRQMQSDATLQALIAQGVPESETRMPCGMVTVLPPARSLSPIEKAY